MILNYTYYYKTTSHQILLFVTSNIVCPVLGVTTYLEVQQGKEYMKTTQYHQELGATAACTLRAAEAVSINNKKGLKPEEIIIGDSWFGSVKAAVAN